MKAKIVWLPTLALERAKINILPVVKLWTLYLVIHFACMERWPKVRIYSYIHSQMAWLIGQGLEGESL